MKKLLCSFLLTFMAVPVGAEEIKAVEPSQEKVVSWETLPALVKASPKAISGWKEFEASKARTGYLWRSFQPTIEGGAFGDGQNVLDRQEPYYELVATAKLNLFRFGRDEGKSRAFDLEAESKKLEASQNEADLILLARSSWLDAWASTEKIKFLEQALEGARNGLERAKKKANAGLTTQTDVQEFKLFIASLSLELVKEQNGQDEAMAGLAGLLNIPVSQITLGDGPKGKPEVQKLMAQEGLVSQLTYLKAKENLSERDGIGVWPWPSLDLAAQVAEAKNGTVHAIPDVHSYFGAQLSISIWDQGEAYAQRKVLEHQSESLFKLSEGLKSEWSAEVQSVQSQLARWVEKLPELDSRVTLADDFLRLVSQEYSRGVKDGRDLEGATREQLEAGSVRVETLAKAWETQARLEALITKKEGGDPPSK